jgi:ATP-binding cassette subfamily G (WHITE) protein 2 (PDR)
VLSNVAAELVWNTGVAVICFLVWFYPMGLFRNARWTGTVHTRSTLVFLVIWSAFLFGSTLAHALIAGAPTAEAASALGNVLGILVRFHWIPTTMRERKTLTVVRCTPSPAS